MSDQSRPPFDPKTFAEAARRADLTRLLTPSAIRAISPEALAAAQNANMNALLSAQRTAAAGCQDAFQAQVAALIAALDAIEAAAGDENDEKTIAKAYENALEAFQALADAATQANLAAFDAVHDVIARGAETLGRPTPPADDD